jgi:hypothetical protein
MDCYAPKRDLRQQGHDEDCIAGRTSAPGSDGRLPVWQRHRYVSGLRGTGNLQVYT